ncbi:MAG: hypothetical protein ABMB14_33855, partial [Myxococcota bacterium]
MSALDLAAPNAAMHLLFERLVFGRARNQAIALTRIDGYPRRIVALGGSATALEAAHPEATFADPAAPTVWAGWPDLVWADLAFGAAADPDRRAAEVWLAMPRGAALVALEVDAVDSAAVGRWLSAGYGVRSDRAGIRAIRRRFTPSHTSVVRSACGTVTTR